MLEAVFEDYEMQPKGPVLLAGDLNGENYSFDVLKEYLQLGWVDIGQHASQWGGVNCDYTCIAPNANVPRGATMHLGMATPSSL